MSKSYFTNDKYLIPFISVGNLEFWSYGEIRVRFNHGNYISLPRSTAKDFLSQYTAWLDSQSMPQL